MTIVTIANIIERKLVEALAPESITVIDESYKHLGHAGARPEGETHFAVEIMSSRFEGLSRVKRHQMVYTALQEYMNNPIHALAIKTDAL